MVEPHVANVVVASSTLVSRSEKKAANGGFFFDNILSKILSNDKKLNREENHEVKV